MIKIIDIPIFIIKNPNCYYSSCNWKYIDNIKDTKNNIATIKISISSAIINPFLKASPIDDNTIISQIKNVNIKIDIIISIAFVHLLGIVIIAWEFAIIPIFEYSIVTL